jgi:hypothetical protein
MLKLDLDDLRVESFTASSMRESAASEIHYTVLRHTEQISCYASDCGTCGGTDCWV